MSDRPDDQNPPSSYNMRESTIGNVVDHNEGVVQSHSGSGDNVAGDKHVRIEETAVGSAIVSGDGNIVYVIHQTTEVQRDQSPADAPVEIGPNPYNGLAAFKESDADRYFGRESQVERLWQRFQDLHEQSAVPRLLPILGPSGCGKSSLARAGLIPELAKRPLPGKEKMRVAVMVPGDSPLKSLAGILARLTRDDLTPEVIKKRGYEEELRKSAKSGRFDFLQDVAETLPDIQAAPLVVMVDQFEEIYSLCKDSDERTAFIENLLYASASATGYVTTVITLRSDFLGETQRHEQLNQIIGSDLSMIVPAMTADELRCAIAEPAKQAGHPLDPATVELLVTDTEGREGALPLLQFALTRIWEGLREGRSPAVTYREMGGVGGALAMKAQDIYTKLDDAEKDIARRVFTGLVQLGEGAKDTRRRVTIQNLMGSRDTPETVKEVIRRFSSPGARLVTLSSQEGHEAAEVTHETLLDQWMTFKSWLDHNRDDLRFQRRLDEAAQYWDLNGRPDGNLWRSPDLDLLIQYQQNRGEDLTLLQNEFFEASWQAEQTRKQEKRRQKRFQTWAIRGLLVLFGIAALQWIRAEKEVINAQFTADSLAAQALFNEGYDIEALQNAIEMGTNLEHKLGKPWLLSGVRPDVKMRALASFRRIVYGIKELNVLQGHTDRVLAVSFSPDGNTIASASSDNTVRLWSIKGEQLHVLQGHTDTVGAVSFSPDGNTIASASSDNTVRLWSIKGEQLHVLQGHTDPVWAVSFSPDGNTIASASGNPLGGGDNTVRLWSKEGEQLHVLQGHTDSVNAVSFSPDGNTIASASSDNTVRLWSIKGEQLHVLQGHTSSVNAVSFSPDGNTIASASSDNTVRLWSIKGEQLHVLQGHTAAVWEVSFSPDGNTIASASFDNTVRLWSIKGEQLHVLQGHTATVNAVSFSPDGNTIASASFDNTVRLWSIKGEQLHVLQGHTDSVNAVSFSPDGNTIASASFDNTVRLWSIKGEQLHVLQGHTDRVLAVSFSPDGNTIASASSDNTVRLWSIKGEQLHVLQGHTDRVLAVSFSPDGNTIASASGNPLGGGDNTVRLWSIKGEQLHVLQGHTSSVNAVSFSPDGNTIASASGNALGGGDNTVRLWSIKGEQLHVLQGHTATVNAVSFSPDGNTIASASGNPLGGGDNTVRLWSIKGEQLHVLQGHTDSVNAVSFSPDGNTIASASGNPLGGGDNTVRLWSIKGEQLHVLQGHTATVWAVSFSPDGNTIASASSDNTVRLWSIKGEQLHVLQGHTDWVSAVSFSPDGNTIASASSDNTVRLWSIKGEQLHVLQGHTDTVSAVSFSPDGNTIASASSDNTVRLWDLNLADLLDRGCDWLSGYLITHPMELIDLTACHPKVNLVAAAPYLKKEGEKLAVAGNVEEATRIFRIAKQWKPDIDIGDPAVLARQISKNTEKSNQIN
jgi:WD40 repeat protein